VSHLALYTDENIDPRLAEQLTQRGYDALSCYAAGNAGQALSDEWQLGFATEHGRAILSYNVDDFVALTFDWITAQREHCGIIFAKPMPLGILITRTARHLDLFNAENHHNISMYLV
jgi:hypothetical protein